MSSDSPAALDVFFSYSHRDEELRDALATHLALLKREGEIRPWHDRGIGGGREWEGEIDEHLESADLILLLISPNFIASDYCFDREMTRALERHEAGEARVVPVILRPTDWQTAPFARLQALPRDGRPVTQWPNRDEALLDVVRGLRSVIRETQRQRGGQAEPARPTPSYPDDETRELSETLDDAYRRKAELSAAGGDATEVVEEILGIRRRLRQGAQLKAGDYLLDGRFQLLEPIGHGGFAQVWKAYDSQGRAVVAIKVLHGQHVGDASRQERFFRGARHMAGLAHPNVVRVIEEKAEDGEYLEPEGVGAGHPLAVDVVIARHQEDVRERDLRLERGGPTMCSRACVRPARRRSPARCLPRDRFRPRSGQNAKKLDQIARCPGQVLNALGSIEHRFDQVFDQLDQISRRSEQVEN
ncbi:MAG: TIR domain-containing protein [bacterium]|nr:TIR domain-containing protein [bacterium]